MRRQKKTLKILVSGPGARKTFSYRVVHNILINFLRTITNCFIIFKRFKYLLLNNQINEK